MAAVLAFRFVKFCCYVVQVMVVWLFVRRVCCSGGGGAAAAAAASDSGNAAFSLKKLV